MTKTIKQLLSEREELLKPVPDNVVMDSSTTWLANWIMDLQKLVRGDDE